VRCLYRILYSSHRWNIFLQLHRGLNDGQNRNSNHAKVFTESGPPVADLTHFRSLARALQYLTFTWPDIAYAVQQICLYMHYPREPHLTAMKHTLHYLWGTLDYDLLL
jgi:hypothetical protein